MALAAAAFTVGTGASFAGTSLAAGGDNVPTVSYTAHADTELTADLLGLNDLQDPRRPGIGTESSPPVADHSAAPAELDDLPLAEDPTDRDGRSLEELVEAYSGTETADEESDCLARAVYYELKGEPLRGQLTVAEVIINRSRSHRFPATICGVVRQRGQFSFVHGGHIPTPPEGSRDWRIAVAIARIAMDDLADGAAPRALFFHARYARPGWHLTRVATVGNHIFYR